MSSSSALLTPRNNIVVLTIVEIAACILGLIVKPQKEEELPGSPPPLPPFADCVTHLLQPPREGIIVLVTPNDDDARAKPCLRYFSTERLEPIPPESMPKLAAAGRLPFFHQQLLCSPKVIRDAMSISLLDHFGALPPFLSCTSGKLIVFAHECSHDNCSATLMQSGIQNWGKGVTILDAVTGVPVAPPPGSRVKEFSALYDPFSIAVHPQDPTKLFFTSEIDDEGDVALAMLDLVKAEWHPLGEPFPDRYSRRRNMRPDDELRVREVDGVTILPDSGRLLLSSYGDDWLRASREPALNIAAAPSLALWKLANWENPVDKRYKLEQEIEYFGSQLVALDEDYVATFCNGKVLTFPTTARGEEGDDGDENNWSVFDLKSELESLDDSFETAGAVFRRVTPGNVQSGRRVVPQQDEDDRDEAGGEIDLGTFVIVTISKVALTLQCWRRSRRGKPMPRSVAEEVRWELVCARALSTDDDERLLVVSSL